MQQRLINGCWAAVLVFLEESKKVRDMNMFREDVTDLCTRILPIFFPNLNHYKLESAQLYVDQPVYFGAHQLYLHTLQCYRRKQSMFTSQQALQFSQWLLQNYDELNTADIKQQADAILVTDACIEANRVLLNK